MQDVFVRVLKNRDRLDLAAPSSLLYRIATNISLNKLRDGKHLEYGFDYEADNLVEQIALADDPANEVNNSSVIRFLFRDKQESTRVMAIMYWVEGFSLEEISAEVRLSVPAVKKRLHTLRQQLKHFKGSDDV